MFYARLTAKLLRDVLWDWRYGVDTVRPVSFLAAWRGDYSGHAFKASSPRGMRRVNVGK